MDSTRCQSSAPALCPLPGAGRTGSCTKLPINAFCVSAAWTCASIPVFWSRSASISSSSFLRSASAACDSARARYVLRVSTEPISSLPVALPSTRIEPGTALAGTSVIVIVCSPLSSFTLPVRVTSAPERKTVTESTRDVAVTLAASLLAERRNNAVAVRTIRMATELSFGIVTCDISKRSRCN